MPRASPRGHLVTEFVEPDPVASALWEDEILRQRIVTDLARAESIAALAPIAADLVRQVNGFDRVMVYRFAPDGHGEVIAESTDRDDSFLGLHYPASDIPEPARRHFRLNLIRLIGDIHAPSAPLVGQGEVDLTFSKLRAVPPVHVEYLANMGVAASMSVSLVANDRLWGLIACHHYAPRRVSWARLRLCEVLGATLSTLLQSIGNAAQLRKSIEAEKCAFGIETAARTGAPLDKLVADAADRILALTRSEGLVLEVGGWRMPAGRVPAELPPLDALEQIADTDGDGVALTDHLAAELPPGAATPGVAGAARLSLSEDGADRLVLLRAPFEETINWAGRPEKIALSEAEGRVRLSPRLSFELWREERRDRSRPFDAADREVLRILRRALHAIASLARERAAMAAREEAEERANALRIALMEAARKSSMGELASALAHELSQPLSAIANYVAATRNELRNDGRALPGMVATYIDETLREAMRAGDLVRRLRDFVASGDLMLEWTDLAETIRHGVALALAADTDPAPDVTFDVPPDMPRVWADPVQIGQVILNLVRNSMVAMFESDPRRIDISVRLEGATEPVIAAVHVRDTGPGIPPDLEEMLFEPLRNSTSMGMGIGLSLCRSIIEAHGGEIRHAPRRDGAEIVFTLPVSGRDRAGRDDAASRDV